MNLVDKRNEVEDNIKKNMKDQNLLGILLKDEVNNILDSIFGFDISILVHNILTKICNLAPSHFLIVFIRNLLMGIHQNPFFLPMENKRVEIDESMFYFDLVSDSFIIFRFL